MKKLLCSLIIFIVLIGCGNEIREIPAGYVGKKLTPSGWDKGILEASQVDIKRKNNDGTYTTLILLEATAITEKESFEKAKDDGEDHRILMGKTPVTADVYVSMYVPIEKEKRNSIFAQITPIQCGERVSRITVKQIYEQFAKMDVRSGIREVLQSPVENLARNQTQVDYVSTHLNEYNAKLGKMVTDLFEKSGVPLIVRNATLSNLKMDETVWDAENKKAAAIAQAAVIDTVGAALRRNPEYILMKKYDTYEKIQEKIGTFTIIEGNPGGVVVGK